MDKLDIGLEVVKILKQNKYQAYVVGGAVRDFLLKRPISDIDITTSAMPKEIAELFEIEKMEESYLSCKVIWKTISFEITTFRKDVCYQDHRHPVTIKTESLEEDLIRRDFTINALAMDDTYQIIDRFGGQEDLKQKKIRTIGKTSKRFEEDALRVLRAIELASRLDFSLDEEIITSFSVDYVKHLSEEYIYPMIKKISPHPSLTGLRLIHTYKVLKSFPFYQVLVDEAVEYGYNKNIFALFYTLHNFLPRNIKISKEEVIHAKEIAELVRNGFDFKSLYYGNLKLIPEAVELYNIVYKKSILEEQVMQDYGKLPIKRYQDIHFDFMGIRPCQRSFWIHKIEREILDGRLSNTQEDILKFIEKRFSK